MNTLLNTARQTFEKLFGAGRQVSARAWLIAGAVVIVIVGVNVVINLPQAPAETRPTASATPSPVESVAPPAPGPATLLEIPSIGASIVTNSGSDASSSQTADTYIVEITGATATRLSAAKLGGGRVIIYGGQRFRTTATGAAAELQINVITPSGSRFQISGVTAGVLNELSQGAEQEFHRGKALHPRASSTVEASVGKLVVDSVGLSLEMGDAAVRVDGNVVYVDDALPSNLAGAGGDVFLNGVAYRVLTASMRSAEQLTIEPWPVVDARIGADLIIRSGFNDIGEQTSVWMVLAE